MLCEQCSLLPLFTSPTPNLTVPKSKISPHHPSFSALDAAAKSGCPACVVFRRAVLDTYSYAHAKRPPYITEQEEDEEKAQLKAETTTERNAEKFQRHLDTQTKDWLPSEPDEELYELIIPPKNQPAGFFVVLKFAEVVSPNSNDAESAAGRKAVRGLVYRRGHWVRVDEEDEEGMMEWLDYVVPFVGVEWAGESGGDGVVDWERGIVGRQRSVNVDFTLARSWIDDCFANHPTCGKMSDTRLPLRVLDVGSADDVDIRLVEHIAEHAPYATLSHCWGKSPTLRLTSETRPSFREKIPYNMLPKTFQDAVTSTRRLGIRYLWIDSLCILQDSIADWEAHCPVMSSIYSSSLVTIAASSAKDAISGFLHPRPPGHRTLINQPHLSLYLHQYPSPSTTYFDLSTFPDRSSPLSNRAWCLQERLLSSRTLHFNLASLSFECCTLQRTETVQPPLYLSNLPSGTLPKPGLSQILTRFHDPLHYWHRIISSYSVMELSFESDRFPALSGLTALISRTTGFDYLAGIWRQDLPRGLAWFVWSCEEVPPPPSAAHLSVPPLPNNNNLLLRAGGGEVYLGPTWSWVGVSSRAANSPSKGNVALGYTSSGLVLKEKLQLTGGNVNVKGCEVLTKGSDPFGEVREGAWLDLEVGFIERLSGLVLSTPYYLSMESEGDGEEGILAVFYPDGDDCQVPGPGVEFAPSLVYLGVWEGAWAVDGAAVALAVEVVEAVEGENTYRRVGLVQTLLSDGGTGTNYFLELLKNAPRKRIRLV